MQWGRAAGAAVGLVAAATAAACAAEVEGSPRAQGAVSAPSSPSVPAAPPGTDLAPVDVAPADVAPGEVAAVGLPTCADIAATVTEVVRGYSLNRDPAVAGGDATMCFFVPDQAGTRKQFAVSMTPFDQTAEQVARTREYLTRTSPGEVLDSPAAARLGGYISDPLGSGSLALMMPGMQVAFLAAGGPDVPREQIVDVLVRLGEDIAG